MGSDNNRKKNFVDRHKNECTGGELSEGRAIYQTCRDIT